MSMGKMHHDRRIPLPGFDKQVCAGGCAGVPLASAAAELWTHIVDTLAQHAFCTFGRQHVSFTPAAHCQVVSTRDCCAWPANAKAVAAMCRA